VVCAERRAAASVSGLPQLCHGAGSGSRATSPRKTWL